LRAKGLPLRLLDMWLTIDIGNSFIKGGLSSADGIVRTFRIPHGAGVRLNDWLRVLRSHIGHESVCRIGIASVVPAATEALVSFLPEIVSCEPMIVSPEINLPFRLTYRTPNTLGMDRLAAAAAAWIGTGEGREGTRDVVAIDAGTAVTFEVITRGGAYRGGAIGPGPNLMAAALGSGTAQLPGFELEVPASAMGQSTIESLQSGVMFGFVGAVSGILARIEAELGSKPLVIATGGWAAFLARQLPAIRETDPDLVLRGIHALMKLNAG